MKSQEQIRAAIDRLHILADNRDAIITAVANNPEDWLKRSMADRDCLMAGDFVEALHWVLDPDDGNMLAKMLNAIIS